MYEFHSPTRVIFGEGAARQAGARARELGMTKALLITGSSRTAQACSWLSEDLAREGIALAVFSEVTADPDTGTVDRGAELYRREACDGIIAFGGGSPIDCAKGIAASVAEGRSIRDFVGTSLAFTKPVPPLIAIPTTAGTGTEVTNAAVFTVVGDDGRRSKKGTSSIYYFPRIALVDPEVHKSMPPSLTAATGMDALTHAIEAYVSRFHTPMSDMYCLEAIRLIGLSLRTACRDGSDMKARSDMALAAALAGVGLSQAGLGMVHGFAHPVGALTGLAHGLANAILLPFVMDALKEDAGDRLIAVGSALSGHSMQNPDEAVAAIAGLGEDIGIPRNLEEAGVSESWFEAILSDALTYRRRKASPRAFTDDELRALLGRMYKGKIAD